jgi:hypothetical protein
LEQQVHKALVLLLKEALPRLVIYQRLATQLMTHTLLTQMEIFMFGTDQLGIALDKLLEQPARLDLQVLQEAQEQREQLDQLELPALWALLDQLVLQEQQEIQD